MLAAGEGRALMNFAQKYKKIPIAQKLPFHPLVQCGLNN